MVLLPRLGVAANPQPAADPAAPVSADSAAASVSRLVVRLRPGARRAEGVALDSAQLTQLQGYLGVALAGASATAAGNEVLELARPVSPATARQLANALRMHSDVAWAEVGRGISGEPKTAVVGGAGAPVVRQFIVTFADAQLAQASRRNEKLTIAHDATLSDAAGTPLHVKRAMVGGAWVAESLAAVDVGTAEAIAARLEASGVVRLAAPDYPIQRAKVPNDPIYLHDDQWYLLDVAGNPYDGIDVGHAWDITTGSASMVIAVVDGGIVAHQDLAGRVLPGYDFITDVTSAGDGDGRDANAADPGDWRTAGMCPSPFDDAADSSWHGTFVTGILAANANNGSGIAGIDWNAQILPVRALGRCGGELSDILDATTWAAGLPVPGAPANPHPAKVINLSVGGAGSCFPPDPGARRRGARRRRFHRRRRRQRQQGRNLLRPGELRGTLHRRRHRSPRRTRQLQQFQHQPGPFRTRWRHHAQRVEGCDRVHLERRQDH